ncbi:MAG: hypothetical protein FJ118_10060 [Deltaproteobacteria bacterium]|nr:hypothetical protein [Deltaproteobacteria bacterium]
MYPQKEPGALQTVRTDIRSKTITSHRDSSAIQWMTAISFLVSSSLLFFFLFEWDRYYHFLGMRSASLSWADAGFMSWLLIAKSLLWFVPILPFLALLMVLGYKSAAAVTLVLSWVCIFYFMATEIICVGFQGWRLWDYAPYFQYMLQNPDQTVWQWIKEWIPIEAGVFFLFFVAAGPAWFFSVRWAVRRGTLRWEGLRPRKTVASAAAAFFLTLSGLFWAPVLCYDQPAIDRIVDALPYPSAVTQHIQQIRQRPGLVSRGGSFFENRVDDSPVEPSLGRLATRAASRLFGLTTDGLTSPVSRVSRTNAGSFSERTDSPDVTGRIHVPFDEEDELLARSLIANAATPGPLDESAFVQRPNLPNIILIIFESFRHSAISPHMMKRLHAWSEQGLRLERHYSGSNCSHLGIFSLFYSRVPLAYHETLDRKIPSQFFESLRRSGYRITFFTSGEIKSYRKVDSYINENTCDVILSKGRFAVSASKEWPDTDRWKLASARTAAQESGAGPQFIFFYLVSSHYPYEFSPEFQVFLEPRRSWQFLTSRERIRGLSSRYANSLLFLEHELMNLVQSIDPARNIVIVTGDHGESLGEDGVFLHANRMSEIQLRTPFVMVGPGIPKRTVSTATAHMDVLPTLLHMLAGRPVPLAHSDGRDLVGESKPPDRVAVVPANGKQWDGLVVLSGNKRLAFGRTINRSGIAEPEFVGEIDEGGDLLPRGDQDPAERTRVEKMR